MKSRRGEVLLHWILLVFIVAFGITYTLTTNIDFGRDVHGRWHTSTLCTVQEAELSLLRLEEQVASLASLEHIQGKDLGCGVHKGTSLLTKNGNWCSLDVEHEIFSEQWDSYSFDGSLLSVAFPSVMLRHGDTCIPTYRRGDDDVYRITPFVRWYNYSQQVVTALGYSEQDLLDFTLDARSLYVTCKDEVSSACVEQNLPENWVAFSDCSLPALFEDGKGVFCAQIGLENLSLAIDFTAQDVSFLS